MRAIVNFLIGLVAASGVLAAPIHTTYLWHMEQPIYWPDQSPYGNGYETAHESILRRNLGAAHPENDVASIFGWPDRVADYQDRPKLSIDAMSGVDAGAQVTYSGGLLRNVGSLAAFNELGYTSAWNSFNQTARSWTTSGGRPLMELTQISYHHSFAPLIDPQVLKKDIQIYQQVYASVWGATPAPSTGFFPPEIAFSERIIPVLRDCGLTWTFVSSTHLSRACSNFPLTLGTGGENCNPPNLSDQVNPSQANWNTQYISRGCSPTDAVPFSFQPHRAIHVDPNTGVADSIVVVPVAMAMSWWDGYQSYSPNDIDAIASHNDPNRPMLVVLGHDGDNAYGGGYSYYMESVPSFTSQAVTRGYEPTTVPEYLADHSVPLSDIVHVEDGAWVNADGDFGDPDFPNWIWPLHSIAGQIEIDNGWAIDAHNWAVITAATNRVLTAEAIGGAPNLAAIQDPRLHSPGLIDLAWHFLLGSLNSGYMYYGTILDMEQKPVVACNEAVGYADQILAGGGDPIGPTIWSPQQWPHNPGAVGFGPLHGYTQVQNPRDFRVWTFISDVSGVASATLKYRLDLDGANPLSSLQNETYIGGAEVSTWRSRAMTRRVFPAGNPYNYGDIVFDELPQYIAQQFTYHLNDSEVTEAGGVLLDYYVEAIDSLGNISRSEIYHTYVGTGQGNGGSGERVWWTPDTLHGGDQVAISYNADLGILPQGVSPIYIHIGHSGWQGVLNPNPVMTHDTAGVWHYTYAIPMSATSVDFVFTDNLGNWDNNSSLDWHISVIPTGGSGFLMDGTREATSTLLGTVSGMNLWADWNGSELYLATDRAQGTGADRFLLIASQPGAMQAAPWSKAGQVAAWSAYLAEEADNGWRGWFDATGGTGSAIGDVLEGTLNLVDEFGSYPPRVFVCVGRYGTANGGALTGQVPQAVVANGNIESSEWIELSLAAHDVTIYPSSGNVTLRWPSVFAASFYRVWRAPSPDTAPTLIGTTTLTNYSDPVTSDRAIYWIEPQF